MVLVKFIDKRQQNNSLKQGLQKVLLGIEGITFYGQSIEVPKI